MKTRTATSSKRTQTQTFEVMDTTLRDGEQTQGVSILAEEKMAIAKALLERVKVDRIEIASARVSQSEHRTVRMICDWAREQSQLERVEILGFVDFKASADWAVEAGCKVINLLTKGSRLHCEKQLRKTQEEHLKDIRQTIRYGIDRGITYNVYLEDWSGGMLRCPDYVFKMIDAYVEMDFKRIMLPDTLGLLEPGQVGEFVGSIVGRYPETWFDFHAHNDYGLGTANSIEALRAGARGVHATVNGLGERAGNAPLDEIVVATRDFTNFRSRVNEKQLVEISKITEVFTGKRIAWNKPICGEGVYTQTAGIHADGDKKGDLYANPLTPERFRRQRTYAMGKLMGKASLDMNLRKLNIELSEEQKRQIMEKIVELADSKKVITTEDLPFIITDVLQQVDEREIEIRDFMVTTNHGLAPAASIKIVHQDQEMQATASGDGGFDAFMKALRLLEKDLGLKIPPLTDYIVRIPPGGKSDALVETTISWEGGIKTRGVNSDQLVAAIEAVDKMLNILATRRRADKRPRHKRKEKRG